MSISADYDGILFRIILFFADFSFFFCFLFVKIEYIDPIISLIMVKPPEDSSDVISNSLVRSFCLFAYNQLMSELNYAIIFLVRDLNHLG